MNVIYQCLRPECRFRFPTTERGDSGQKCPRCGAPTRLVVLPYDGVRVEEDALPKTGTRIEVILDNIRSALNVGSIFRTADGAAIDHLHLCGITPTPGHPKVTKTALGAECMVKWSQHWDALEAAREIIEAGFHLIALESAGDSESLFHLSPFVAGRPIALVIGNEVTGIDPEILRLCDRKVHLPMYGHKRSLNVSIAFGVAAYFLRYIHLQPKEN